MTLTELQELLPEICRQDTAYDPKGWSPDNPLAEHCAVVALLVQELFGGELVRVRIPPSKRFPRGGWHWYIQLSDHVSIDLTKEQFGGKLPRFGKKVFRSRQSVLRIASVRTRYNRLRRRFLAAP